MKRLLFTIAAVSALCLASCTKELDELDATLHELELRVTQVEVAVQAAKSDVKAMQILAKAQDAAIKISSVTPTDAGGFVITFSNGQSFTLNSAQDGADGVNAKALSIAKDTDGVWYWTLAGEWMLDATGAKCIVCGYDGIDGITPQIRVNDGLWEVSPDGKTWSQLCEDRYAPSSIKVIETPADVTFVLADGSEIVLKKGAAFRLVAETVDFTVQGGEELEVPYTVEAGDGTVAVTVYSTSGGYKATVSGDGDKGVIKVTVPATAVKGTVIVSAFQNSTSEVCSQCLTFTPAA